MPQKPSARKKPARGDTATERAARLSAKINGRYAITAAILGPIIAAAVTLAITHGFGTFGRSNVGIASASGHTSGPPVRIDSATVDETGREGEIYVLPQRLILTAGQLKSLNHLMGRPGYDQWFASHGAVDPDYSTVKLVVEGNRENPVQIIDMGVIENCSRPLNGTLFYNAPPGGPTENEEIDFDLNLPRPVPVDASPGGRSDPGSYFWNHTVSLKYGEVSVFRVTSSSARYCAYKLTLTVVDGTKTITEVVGNGRQPFRVTGLSRLEYGALYVGGTSPGEFEPLTRQNPRPFQQRLGLLSRRRPQYRD